MSAARAGVLDALRQRGGAATVRDVADALELHPNTVREHLDALVSSRLVVRQQAAPTGRGRPALLYRALHDAGDVARDYELLAGVLAAHISEQPDAAEASLRAGQAWGHQLRDQQGSSDPVDVLAQLGFDPSAPDEQGTVVLHACPVLDVARRFPGVVCTAHLGMTQALAAGAGQDASDMELVPMGAPDGCLLRMASWGQSTGLAD